MNKYLIPVLLSLSFSANAFKPQDRVFKVGGGTGFLVQTKTGKTYIITNWHVCAGQRSLAVYHESAPNVIRHATIVHTDSKKDLCLAEFATTKKGYKLAPEARSNQPISIFGHPGGSLKQIKSSGNLGVISSQILPYPPYTGDCEEGFEPKYRKVGPNYYQLESCNLSIKVQDTSAEGAPGSSGSPVLNAKGEVVGVVNHTIRAGQKSPVGIIPLETVREYLDLF